MEQSPLPGDLGVIEYACGGKAALAAVDHFAGETLIVPPEAMDRGCNRSNGGAKALRSIPRRTIYPSAERRGRLKCSGATARNR